MDITKCTGVGCSVKSECVRFMVPGNEFRQSYIDPPGKDKNCGSFMPYVENYYIVIDGKVVAHSSGKPRIFAKIKKAKNFINGHRFEGAIIVTDIAPYSGRLKIEV